MAKRKRKRSRKKTQQEYPGWVWMLFGLSIGLSVAFAIYMKDREASGQARSVAPAPAPAHTASAIGDDAAAEAPKPEDQPEHRFDFYDMLPNFEVIIPEQEPDVHQDTGQEPIEQPGVYVLQAGSFSDFSDADRRRAELALLGVESRIQRVSIDDRTYHRVRIGPTRDLDHLNMLRARLRQADIDVLRIRLGD